jgi:glycosyltransferase involved in cell wall biosynthesis
MQTPTWNGMNAAPSSNARVHIALLSDGVSPYVMGGIQRHTRMLAIHLARAGAHISLFHTTKTATDRAAAAALSDFPADARRSIRSYLVEYPQAGRLPGHYIGDSRRYSERLLARYRSEGLSADFVYAQGLTGLAFTEARQTNPGSLPPIAINQHGYEMFQHAADFRTHLQHLILRRPFARLARDADWVFTFPARIRKIFSERCGVPSERIIEMPNAIDSSWIVEGRAVPKDRRRFVFVGRHERRKGVPELLRAISQIEGDGQEFHFIGPIPEAVRLKRVDVLYHGPISDTQEIIRVLDHCDVLVCPSFAEGMPTVVLEAMARGLAIIATDVGATSEWVDAANGILLPSPDVAALRDAICRLRDMPALDLQELQLSSLAKSRRYTWHNVAQNTIAAISGCIGISPSPPAPTETHDGHRQ